MRVELTEAQRIASDGLHSKWYAAGEVLDLPAALAEGLVRDKLAIVSKARPKVEEPKARVKPDAKQEYQSRLPVTAAPVDEPPSAA